MLFRNLWLFKRHFDSKSRQRNPQTRIKYESICTFLFSLSSRRILIYIKLFSCYLCTQKNLSTRAEDQLQGRLVGVEIEKDVPKRKKY